MKSKIVFLSLFSLFFIPISLFSDCYFNSPDMHLYFTEGVESSDVISGAGKCTETTIIHNGPFDSDYYSVTYSCYITYDENATIPKDLVISKNNTENPEYATVLTFSGTPAVGTAGAGSGSDGSYTIPVTMDVSGTGTSCPVTSTIILIVQPEGSSFPPSDVEGTQSSTSALTPLSPKTLRAKNDSSTHDYKNIITWRMREGGPTVAAFRIYRDKALTKLVKQIPAGKKQSYRHVIRKRSPDKNYVYYIVSVSDKGILSSSIRLKIKGVNKVKGGNKGINKKPSQGCSCN